MIHEFQRKFKNQKDISKPEEANGIHKIDIYKDVDEDFEDVKEAHMINNSSPLTKFKSFVDISSPKELPKMILRVPETVKKPEPKKAEELEKPVTESEVIIEVPKSVSPHED